MSDIKAMFNSIPPFTRYYMSTVFIISFGMTYGLINPYYLLLDFESVFKKLQVWRFLSSFLFMGKFSQNFLFSLVMAYFTLTRIEDYFKNKMADFATLVLFNMFAVTFYACIYGDYMVLTNPFIFAMSYVWCKLEPDAMVSIWGFPVQASYLPWVLIGLSLLTGGDPFKDLIGVAAGHTYIYLKLILPQSHGYNLLRTPKLIENLIKRLETWANSGRRP